MPRIRLMGMPLDAMTCAEVVEEVFAGLAQGRGGWVITPNLDQLRQFVAVGNVKALFDDADVVVADGAALVLASRLQGTSLPERVAGSTLIYPLAAEAARSGRSIYFLGGNPGAAAGAAEKLVRLNPDLRVAAVECPEFGFERTPGAIAAMQARLREAEPDIVIVCLGAFKQERLIRELRSTLPSAWFLGLGVTFSFVSGEIPRAPLWMQRHALEWAHRLWSEPRRLFSRYILRGLPFAGRLAVHCAARRIRSDHTAASVSQPHET